MAEKRPKVPAAPTGLGLRARRLWKQVQEDFELNPAEVMILEQACRVTDTIEKLEQAWAIASATTAGSKGQTVANPLPREIREERLLLARLLDQLGIPTEGAESAWDGLSASERARKAAYTRWRRA